MDPFFRSLAQYPNREDANGVMMRMVDGLGHRFHWATDGLRPEDHAFSPGAGTKTIGQLVEHVWGLVNWVHGVMGADGKPDGKPEGATAQRESALALLLSLRARLDAMTVEELFAVKIRDVPVWHVINGPLADALTHTGQISSFRRLAGNTTPRHNVFLGGA
jgi:hypothetical protein